MDQSPLVQQTRPEVLKPKIVGLYEGLFQVRSKRERNSHQDLTPGQDEVFEQTEGFWHEFFLLKPDATHLRGILGEITAEDLLHHHELACQQLFTRAIKHFRTSSSPSDEIALDTLTVFLDVVLNKRYASPSSDIIAILAGLEDVDAVLTDFVSGLDEVIKDGRSLQVRRKAVRVASAAVSGAYQTGLVSYFINRDLFPSLMRFIEQVEKPSQSSDAFSLLGLLANYNKFEFSNPYRLRLEDSINENAIAQVTRSIGNTSTACKDGFIALQDDQPEGWTFGNTLNMIFPSPKPQYDGTTQNDEDMRTAFAALPPPEANILIPTYEFAIANKLFCINFVTAPAPGNEEVSPFADFLSFSSYLVQNAYRSIRASVYASLCLLTLQILMEDQSCAKSLSSGEIKIAVRLCRQRQPYLPLIKAERVPAAAVLDVLIGALTHNLRLKLDVEFYHLLLNVMLRTLSFLAITRTKLTYHWSELWRNLLSLLRFFTNYPVELSALPSIHAPVDTLLHIFALAISSGEAFLHDAASYDDLFYKIFEAATSSAEKDKDMLAVLRQHYAISTRSAANSAAEIMSQLTNHYRTVMEQEKSKKKVLRSAEVNKVIKQGYETLDIQSRGSWEAYEKYREVERRVLLKKAARIAVVDVKSVLAKLTA